MSDTYTQLHIHIIFAVQFRAALIDPLWRERLHKYISAIVQKNSHKMLQVNSMPDHIHILIGLNPTQSISSLVQNLKSMSSNWINENKLTKDRFAWQGGYGAFAYSKSHVGKVIQYIKNQQIHHKSTSFKEEYTAFLTAFDIDFEERNIFNELK